MAEAFEKEKHAADEKGHDGEADDQKTDPSDGADRLIIEFAGVGGGVVDFVGPEEVLGEEEVGHGGY